MSTIRYLSMALALLIGGLVLAGCSLLKSGGDFPASDITFVIPFAPGGPTDTIGRMLAQESEPLLKRKIVIANKPGATGIVGTADVVAAKPDGYTIGYVTASITHMAPLLQQLPYDRDAYQLVVKLAELPNALVVKADAPWKTMQDFLAEAKRRPGQLRVSTPGATSEPHLILSQFGPEAKVNAVPFSGGAAEALTALLGGQVEAHTATIINVVPQAQAGTVRILTIFQKDRHPLFPDVPSSVELGHKITLPATHFVIGPKNLDQAALEKLNKTFSEVVKGKKFQDFAKEKGISADPTPLDQFAKDLTVIGDQYAQFAKESGAR